MLAYLGTTKSGGITVVHCSDRLYINSEGSRKMDGSQKGATLSQRSVNDEARPFVVFKSWVLLKSRTTWRRVHGGLYDIFY